MSQIRDGIREAISPINSVIDEEKAKQEAFWKSCAPFETLLKVTTQDNEIYGMYLGHHDGMLVIGYESDTIRLYPAQIESVEKAMPSHVTARQEE